MGTTDSTTTGVAGVTASGSDPGLSGPGLPSPSLPSLSLPNRWRSARVAVGATYAAQGFGYATVVTSLPALKSRQGIDDTAISLVVLLVCVAAAGGSVVAERLATRRGSRTAVVVGLALQALAVVLVAATSAPMVFVGGFAVYGLGLGMVDAAAGIQGVLVQRLLGRTVMSSFFAAYTAAAIVAAVVMSGLAASPRAATWALLAAGVLLISVSWRGRDRLVPPAPGVVEVLDASSDAAGGSAPGSDSAPVEKAVPVDDAAAERPPLPRRGIWLFGGVVLVAFVADSAVSTWSSIYLDDVLRVSAGVVPLGYAAYQATILVTRLVGDRWVRRSGRASVAAVAAVVGALGFLPVAVIHTPLAAIIGFALVGVGVGALVPLAFSAAGELAPHRVDEVVARVNVFNYAGAVLGAVVVGLLSDGPGLAVAFLLPLVLLAPVAGIARRFASPAGHGTVSHDAVSHSGTSADGASSDGAGSDNEAATPVVIAAGEVAGAAMGSMS